ncbi:MAG: hypothetical protein A2909_01030 [Candidatus Tagabacteria bacterium RIFCSPLOWO2_01_FULL_39_11]|uniref:RecF/RecN/SMC N-terminal domain-containing protein n=1 Tax=Candidatus Tagabacteria bacterium RIFCSPLOWO2_01_FULL_39_11 TaxID=1802295 RepID=A0A1G2LQ14_9BACT|nr:MAG: hypothetical protein A2909_01030 [Candidatus Tagabacteria bacterium RIFCSPLOWO2_01_FULL_39_11]
MRLARIELCGFKSFARTAVLDFPSSISAIIGPNGSGKSNIVESIRWALGEQSLKSLRTRKGEDMIFNGTPGASRLGKARVTLVFDNLSGRSPLEYEKIIVERNVYRDGANEYFLNSSPMRYKDMADIFASAGLSASHHFIISQGEADKFLKAGPVERKGLVEESLGLGAFQLKLARTEHKIEKTKENISRIQTLKEELKPHLKFLKSQALKFERVRLFKDELKENYEKYLKKEFIFLKKTAGDLNLKKSVPSKELEEILKKIQNIKDKLHEDNFSGVKALDGERERLFRVAGLLDEIQKERIEHERNLGKIEGILSSEKEFRPKKGKILVEFKKVEKFIYGLQNLIEHALGAEKVDIIRRSLKDILAFAKEFFQDDIGSGSQAEEDFNNKILNLKKEKENISLSIKDLSEKEAKLKEEQERLQDFIKKRSRAEREIENERYLLESRAGDLKDILRSFGLQEEKLKLRREEFEREKKEAWSLGAQIDFDAERPESEQSGYNNEEREAFQKLIGKIKLKIEESGGINSDIAREYEDIKKRDDFFSRELEDLDNSLLSLEIIIRELKEKIKFDFKNGLERINKEFSEFFKAIFGGGKAELNLKPQISSLFLRKEGNSNLKSDPDFLEESEDGEARDAQKESGLEIFVNFPRKRVGSLDMLSGGERSLTALALLCAITYVNPPPFLIMDEIDAALDEVNSKRCGGLLNVLSKKTQLIVITHNREIIKKAGVLYGVTMSGDGSSRLLSVKLDETD